VLFAAKIVLKLMQMFCALTSSLKGVKVTAQLGTAGSINFSSASKHFS
jgi:hypothetical protein